MSIFDFEGTKELLLVKDRRDRVIGEWRARMVGR